MQQFYLAGERRQARIELGTALKTGGEAKIYEVVGMHGCLAKIYTRTDSPRHATRDKLEAMLATRPQNMVHKGGGVERPQFAWPTHIVVDEDDAVRGFLMRELPRDDVLLLTCYMSRSQQKGLTDKERSLPHRLSVCANLASMVTEMHRLEHLVVDLKPANVAMFKGTGILCLLDNDSFSIAKDGRRYPATAMSSEYRAPEVLIHKLVPAAVQDEGQDRFALAVLMFQILDNGVHPFQGRPQFHVDPWHIDLAVEKGYYPYGLEPHPGILPSVGSVHTCWPEPLRRLFDRAFAGGAGAGRPSAREWRDALHGMLREQGMFAACERKPDDVTHIHFAGLPCQECLFEAISVRMAAEHAQRRSSSPSAAGAAPASVSSVDAMPSAVNAAPPSRIERKRRRGKLLYAAVIAAGLLAAAWVLRDELSPVLPPPAAGPQAETSSSAPAADSVPVAEPAAAPAPAAQPVPAAEPADPHAEALAGAMERAYKDNLADLRTILAAAHSGNDALARERAEQLMRSTDFTAAFADWQNQRAAGRKLSADVMGWYEKDAARAAAEQRKAVLLAPLDRELASNLAYYEALARDAGAVRTAVYALSLPRPAERTGTSAGWQALAMALATAGKGDASTAALLVGLAITNNLAGFCKSLLAHERLYGAGLREPIDAVLRRIQDGGLEGKESCPAPGQQR